MTDIIQKIQNSVKTKEGLDYAVEAALNPNDGCLNNQFAGVIHKKMDAIKTFSGLIIGSGYDYDGDIYYFILKNETGIEQCIIYNERDYYKLCNVISDMDIKLPVTIKGSGILQQGTNEISFNTSLNTLYIEE